MKVVVVVFAMIAIPFNIGVAYNYADTYCRVDNAFRDMVGEAYVSPYCD
jgi:hypothetical protein